MLSGIGSRLGRAWGGGAMQHGELLGSALCSQMHAQILARSTSRILWKNACEVHRKYRCTPAKLVLRPLYPERALRKGIVFRLSGITIDPKLAELNVALAVRSGFPVTLTRVDFTMT